MNSSSERSSSRLHRPPGGLGQVADDVLDQHLLLGSEAAADAGLDDPDVLDLHRSMSGASMRRVWNGTWVAVRTTMRSSGSSQATEMWFSIGTCWTWCTR